MTTGFKISCKILWNGETAASKLWSTPFELVSLTSLQGDKAGLKPPLMPSTLTMTRIIVICFMIVVGFAFAKAVYWGSFMGIVLATISFGAAVYFLYILSVAKKEINARRTSNEIEQSA